jgi:uncharacterized repeat protein (TIGR02543 family)
VDGVLYKSNSSVVVLGNTGGLALDGYSFIGWSYGGVVYNAGDTLMIPESDVVLVAVWDIDDSNIYIISYVLDGGVNVVGNPSWYRVSDLPLEIADPYRAWYDFLCWSVLFEDGTERVLAGSIIPVGVSGDIVLTACWSPVIRMYNIFYVLEGGSNAVGNPVTYTVENLPLSIGDPSREGYIFLGWTVLYANGTGGTSQVSYSIPAGTTGDVVLSAVWYIIPDTNTYTIHYVLDGGVNAAGNPSSYMIPDLPLSIAAPSWVGYTFLGWTVVYSDGQMAITEPELSYRIIADTTGDITLTAHWALTEPKVTGYSLIYHGNGYTSGVIPVDNNSPYAGGTEVAVLGQGSMIRAGYDFVGWATSAGATAPTYRSGSAFAITADTILYAVWSRTTGVDEVYSISYRYTGVIPSGVPSVPGTVSGVSSGTVRQVAVTPMFAGYTFSGWFTSDVAASGGSFVMPSRHVVFSGNWTARVYMVNYDVNGAVFNVTYRSVVWDEAGLLPVVIPERVGYVFEGWFFEGVNITEKVRFCDLVVNDEVLGVTLVAQWSMASVGDDGGAWAVVNLVLCVLGVLFVLLMGVYMLTLDLRSGSGVWGWRANRFGQFRLVWFLVVVVLGILGVLVFLLTQNLNQSMVLVDQWTVLNGVIFVIEAVGLFFVFYPKLQITAKKKAKSTLSSGPVT